MRARNAPDSAPWMMRWSYVDVIVIDAGGLTILRNESRVQPGMILERLDDRRRDDVRERRLGLPVGRQMIVDDAAILFQRLDRNGSDGGRRRNRQRRFHVLGDLAGGSAQGDGIGLNG